MQKTTYKMKKIINLTQLIVRLLKDWLRELNKEKLNSRNIDPYIAIFLDGDYQPIDLVSIKDKISEFCNQNKMSMMFSGIRHFKH